MKSKHIAQTLANLHVRSLSGSSLISRTKIAYHMIGLSKFVMLIMIEI